MRIRTTLGVTAIGIISSFPNAVLCLGDTSRGGWRSWQSSSLGRPRAFRHGSNTHCVSPAAAKESQHWRDGVAATDQPLVHNVPNYYPGLNQVASPGLS